MKKRTWYGLGLLALLAISLAGSLYAADGTIHTWTGKGSRRNTTEMELRSPSLGTAADLIPGTDGAGRVGIAANSWASGDFDDITVNDDLAVTDDLTVTDDVAINGDTTLGDASTDNVTVVGSTWTVPELGVTISTSTGGGQDTILRAGVTWYETATTTPTVPSTSYAGLFAVTETVAELKVQDGSGNITKVSPHNGKNEWVFHSVNVNTGKSVFINMEKFIRRMEELTGERFIFEAEPQE